MAQLSRRPTVAGLFAGIGGIELGFAANGFETCLLCESDPGARAVLEKRVPGGAVGEPVAFTEDINDLDHLHDADVVTAGFPCQDLSQAGRMAGITGSRSGLVSKVFDLLRASGGPLPNLVLENVPFMLRLDGGSAMTFLVESLEELGYSWAYRVVDALSFGLPQRHERVVLVASTSIDPAHVLLGEDSPRPVRSGDRVAGFYWTEGNRGVGWAPDAVPPLKGGSAIGIASPPAIAVRGKGVFTPTIEAAERLQGFDSGWTEPVIAAGITPRHRWRLVGNAVPVPMSTWVASRLAEATEAVAAPPILLEPGAQWPNAAFGDGQSRWVVGVGPWPVETDQASLLDLVGEDIQPLSLHASRGFLNRLQASSLRRADWFEEELEIHVRRMDNTAVASSPA